MKRKKHHLAPITTKKKKGSPEFIQRLIDVKDLIFMISKFMYPIDLLYFSMTNKDLYYFIRNTDTIWNHMYKRDISSEGIDRMFCPLASRVSYITEISFVYSCDICGVMQVMFMDGKWENRASCIKCEKIICFNCATTEQPIKTGKVLGRSISWDWVKFSDRYFASVCKLCKK